MEAIDISRLETQHLHFPKGDVLEKKMDRKERSRLIHKATYFGNIIHKKVNIIFSTDRDTFRIFTTIWLEHDGKIWLKDDVSIPVERIREINIEF